MSTSAVAPRVGAYGSMLIETKLHAPEQPLPLVERRTLLHRLSASTARLVLVSAPPGWGKSTLLTAWLAREHGFDGAWVSLDEGDDEAGENNRCDATPGPA